MTQTTQSGADMPVKIGDHAANAPYDAIKWREFLALATSFGVTAATAYSMLGLA